MTVSLKLPRANNPATVLVGLALVVVFLVLVPVLAVAMLGGERGLGALPSSPVELLATGDGGPPDPPPDDPDGKPAPTLPLPPPSPAMTVAAR